MHAPRLAGASPVPQAIEDHGDRFVVADFRELDDQFDGFVIGHSPVLARRVAGDAEFCMHATFPMQVEHMLGRIVTVGRDNVFEYGSQDALLQFHRRGRMMPQQAQIGPKLQQPVFLCFAQWLGPLAECVEARFHLRHLCERMVPPLLQFAGDQTVLWVDRIKLTLGAAGFIPRFSTASSTA
jgi:hypothetical protein